MSVLDSGCVETFNNLRECRAPQDLAADFSVSRFYTPRTGYLAIIALYEAIPAGLTARCQPDGSCALMATTSSPSASRTPLVVLAMFESCARSVYSSDDQTELEEQVHNTLFPNFVYR